MQQFHQGVALILSVCTLLHHDTRLPLSVCTLLKHHTRLPYHASLHALEYLHRMPCCLCDMLDGVHVSLRAYALVVQSNKGVFSKAEIIAFLESQ